MIVVQFIGIALYIKEINRDACKLILIILFPINDWTKLQNRVF